MKKGSIIMKKSVIFCKDGYTKGIIDFYITSGSETLYLFSQKFRKSTYSRYSKGLILDDAISFKKVHNDKAITNVIRRLTGSISYIEKTYGIPIMNKTISARSA